MRLDKFLANLKYGSRKTIKNMVKNNQVTVNGQIPYSSDVKIDVKHDKINVDGKEVFYKENIVLSFYKPAGYLSSHKDHLYPSLFHLIKPPYNQFDLKIAGRLDYDSEGLMILTNDGWLIHKITHPKKHVKKEYEVTLNQAFDEVSKQKLLEGVTLIDEDGSFYEAKAGRLEYQGLIAKITIYEGKFHQVKKMFKKVGYEVLNLKRTQIGNLKLELKPGQYKAITESDIFEG